MPLVTLKSAFLGATLSGISSSKLEAEIMHSEVVSSSMRKTLDKKFKLRKAINVH